MGISITGREFSQVAANNYELMSAVRKPLREKGVSMAQRNDVARLLEAQRLGLVFDYENGTVTKAPPAPTIEELNLPPEWRTMYMMARPGYEYVFAVAPGSFTVEGFGAELSEIPRPYNIPIVDIKAGKSRRVSFEFLVVKRALALNPRGQVVFDYINNFYGSIEDDIKQLQLIADMGMPVGFDNVNAIMRENYWYIDNLTFTYTRDNRTGETVSASCNISLIEYKPLRQKFILLPKFRYGKFPTTKKPKVDNEAQGVKDRLEYQRRMREEAIARNKVLIVELKKRGQKGQRI